MATDDAARLPELRLTELLEVLSGTELLASGSAAALTGAMAAEIVVMVSRASTGWRDAPGAAAQARALSSRLVPLASADAAAFARVISLRSDPDTDERDLGPALERAAELPLAIADAACATAELAATAAEWAIGFEKADAIAAAALAEGATRAAAALVHANLTTVKGDARAAHADALVELAAAARERATAAT